MHDVFFVWGFGVRCLMFVVCCLTLGVRLVFGVVCPLLVVVLCVVCGLLVVFFCFVCCWLFGARCLLFGVFGVLIV